MGFLISFALIFMMLIVNQATLVGQTTAEGVLEFPKHEIRDLRSEALLWSRYGEEDAVRDDIILLSLKRNHALVQLYSEPYPDIMGSRMITIRFNNGVTVYEEITLLI
ncbi:MAG: hypothetical protein Q7J09_04185 [Methanocalculus sp.]|uniref:hypothetical protein n=1 Tax=Methanocalculus sp. TaxID=2004547 RepID=UPI00271B637C|nr:hypothetical protein [Methanocalculus sp.]MDO9539186.1 hypothetical protein [Methanocalculus sp.]